MLRHVKMLTTEIKKITMQLKVGVSPGIDGIPAVVYHHWEKAVLDKLLDLFINYREKGILTQELMYSLSLCKETRERNRAVKTTAAPPYSSLQAKFWLASC